MNHRNYRRPVQLGNRIALVLLGFLALASAEAAGPYKLRLLLEPTFMHPEVSFPIPGSKQTLLVPVRETKQGLAYLSRKQFVRLGLQQADYMKAARTYGAEVLEGIEPEYSRNSKGVIEYARVAADERPVASTLLAPELVQKFESVFGPEFLVAVPNRFTIYLFPKLAGNIGDYTPMILDAYRNTRFPVSLEVFEVSRRGLRAVGRFEAP